MARNLPVRRRDAVADQVLDIPEASVVDILDHVLNKGVMASGDVTLGVAGVDLIYLRLSAILCSADRVLAAPAHKTGRKRSTRVRPRR
jgi:Gas vesicle protein